MPTITHELVLRYILSARPFVEHKNERYAMELALRLNVPDVRYNYWLTPKATIIPKIGDYKPDKAVSEVNAWQRLVWKEIHTALCTSSRKYKKHVSALKDNVHLLIGAIAVQVAGKLGIAVAVVAALVAALLRIAFEMGISVFCQRSSSGML